MTARAHAPASVKRQSANNRMPLSFPGPSPETTQSILHPTTNRAPPVSTWRDTGGQRQKFRPFLTRYRRRERQTPRRKPCSHQPITHHWQRLMVMAPVVRPTAKYFIYDPLKPLSIPRQRWCAAYVPALLSKAPERSILKDRTRRSDKRSQTRPRRRWSRRRHGSYRRRGNLPRRRRRSSQTASRPFRRPRRRH